ncbi:ABC transporter ATP-binding protein [Tardisphaera miroshnichenkoae]
MTPRSQGKETRIITFSRSKVRDFSPVPVLLSQLIEGKGSKGGEAPTSKWEPRRSSASAFRWLLGYVSHYKGRVAAMLVLSVLGTVASLVPPYLIELLINGVFTARDVGLLLPISLAVLGAYAFGTALGAGSSYFLNWLDQRITRDIRDEVYTHLQRLPMDFYERMSSGRLLSRIIDDVGRAEWFLTWGAQQLVVNFFMTAGVTAAMFLISWQLASIILLPIPVLFLIFLFYAKVATGVYHKAWWRWADVDTYLTDAIEGTSVVKAFSREREEVGKFVEKLRGVFHSNMAATVTDLKFFPFMDLMVVASGIAVLYFGGVAVIRGTLSLGALVAITTYMGMLYGPLFSLVSLSDPLQQTKTSAERVLEILKEEPISEEGEGEAKVKGEIEFSHVTFGYDPFLPVMYDVSFRVPAGTTLGVAGPSGSGKTTLTKLLMRFYDPQSGIIRVDGVDLKRIRRSSWRRQVSIVLQEPFLFDGSVAYNVTYGVGKAEPELVVGVVKAVGAHDFVMKLPLAYDSWVGERGSQLSGGAKADAVHCKSPHN